MNQSLTCILVDDERAARNELEALLLDHCPEVNVVGQASNVSDARKQINELSPDLVFLDVKMPGERGFDLLEEPLPSKTAVVLVTAYDQFAVEAFRKAAVHYLIKPCEPEELRMAVDRAAASLGDTAQQPAVPSDILEHAEPQAEDRIVIAHRSGFKLLKTEDILYLESARNYTTIHLVDGTKQVSSKNLGFYEKQLPASRFFRIHRSYLINLDHLEGYDSNRSSFVELRGGHKLEISKRRLSIFMQRFLGH